MSQLATFMFHRLGQPRFVGDVYTVPADWLARLVQLAGEHSCQCIRLDALFDGQFDADPTYVALTFDDGYQSDFQDALPILQAAQIPATFFIVPAWVGQPDYLTWSQVRSMADAQMLIGSHTVSHRWLPELPTPALMRELSDARKIISDQVGREVTCLSLPGGYYNRRVVDAAYQAGYRLVASSNYGLDPMTTSERQSGRFIRRNSVDSRSSWAYLAGLLSGSSSTRVQLITGVKRLVANWVGPTRYKRLSDRVRRGK